MQYVFWAGVVVLLGFLFWPSPPPPTPPLSVPVPASSPNVVLPPPNERIRVPQVTYSVPPTVEPLSSSPPRDPEVNLPGQVFEKLVTGVVPEPFSRGPTSPPLSSKPSLEAPHLRGEIPVTRRRR